LLANESVKRFAPGRSFPSGRQALDDQVEQRPQARQPAQVPMIPNIGIPPWRRLAHIDWHNARDAVAQWPWQYGESAALAAELRLHQAAVAAHHNLGFGKDSTPGPGEVLVRIAASSVNPLDTKIHAGAAEHARHPLPAILGTDLAGTVEAVGSEVTDFRPGDEVYGMAGCVGGLQGTLAEYAAVDADLLAVKPAKLSMQEAAALPPWSSPRGRL
jgi:Alcohol dehydrogenase GroES-like domain